MMYCTDLDWPAWPPCLVQCQGRAGRLARRQRAKTTGRSKVKSLAVHFDAMNFTVVFCCCICVASTLTYLHILKVCQGTVRYVLFCQVYLSTIRYVTVLSCLFSSLRHIWVMSGMLVYCQVY